MTPPEERHRILLATLSRIATVAATALPRPRRQGLDAAALLADKDSTQFFERLDNVVFPEPTRTNVNDCRIILIG